MQTHATGGNPVSIAHIRRDHRAVFWCERGPARIDPGRGRLVACARQEFQDFGGDELAVFLQGEMAGIQKVEFEVGEIGFVRVGAVGGEDVVVLTPDDTKINQRGVKAECPRHADRAASARAADGPTSV